MPDVMTLLHLDHRKIAKVLDLIQQQATNMAQRAPVNYRLLEITLDYLSGYPDQCHHPREDLIYRKLLSRFPDIAKSLTDLVEEHEKLAYLTRNLSRALGESPHGLAAVNEGLADQLRAFLGVYRRHMLMEEQHFFPLALQRLSHSDFAEIDFTLFDQLDSVFNREAEGKFAELRDEILRLGITEKAGADQREESALLSTFVDIAAFNESMQRIGDPMTLIRSSEGGYELVRMGNILVHIPACSETRAAWCAYFFWKATTRTSDIPSRS